MYMYMYSTGQRQGMTQTRLSPETNAFIERVCLRHWTRFPSRVNALSKRACWTRLLSVVPAPFFRTRRSYRTIVTPLGMWRLRVFCYRAKHVSEETNHPTNCLCAVVRVFETVCVRVRVDPVTVRGRISGTCAKKGRYQGPMVHATERVQQTCLHVKVNAFTAGSKHVYTREQTRLSNAFISGDQRVCVVPCLWPVL